MHGGILQVQLLPLGRRDIGVAARVAAERAAAATVTDSCHKNIPFKLSHSRSERQGVYTKTFDNATLMLIQLLYTNPLLFLLLAVAFAISIAWHEFSHVFSAYLQGDNTGKDMGRLSLNPLRHLDPIGSLLLLFVPFGWGKPAPYNPYNLRNQRYGPLLVALAGPFSNLILLVVFGTALHFLAPALGGNNALIMFLQMLVALNTVLMVFNLIPVPPLDGSSIIQAVLGPTRPDILQSFNRYGPPVLIGIVVMSFLTKISLLSFLINPVLSVVQKIIGVPIGF